MVVSATLAKGSPMCNGMLNVQSLAAELHAARPSRRSRDGKPAIRLFRAVRRIPTPRSQQGPPRVGSRQKKLRSSTKTVRRNHNGNPWPESIVNLVTFVATKVIYLVQVPVTLIK